MCSVSARSLGAGPHFTLCSAPSLLPSRCSEPVGGGAWGTACKFIRTSLSFSTNKYSSCLALSYVKPAPACMRVPSDGPCRPRPCFHVLPRSARCRGVCATTVHAELLGRTYVPSSPPSFEAPSSVSTMLPAVEWLAGSLAAPAWDGRSALCMFFGLVVHHCRFAGLIEAMIFRSDL